MLPLSAWFAFVVTALSSQTHSDSDATPCHTTHSISGVALSGHSYRKIPSRSLDRCIFACEADSGCFSVNFILKTNVCELNSATKERFHEHMIALHDVVYMESVTRASNPSLCTSILCLNGGTCARFSSEHCICRPGYVGHICEHGKGQV